AARSFQPISDNQGFQYLYLPCRLKEKISIVRDKLAKLHIATSRILDIQFPTKTIVGLLVHNDYVPTIRNRLAKAKISTIDEFDPLSGTILRHPELLTLSEADKNAKASEFHTKRCLRALDYIRKPVAFSVAKTFLE
ncbi:hypothetical protein BDF20DRAFT_808969, partial [Mycotypha africana]